MGVAEEELKTSGGDTRSWSAREEDVAANGVGKDGRSAGNVENGNWRDCGWEMCGRRYKRRRFGGSGLDNGSSRSEKISSASDILVDDCKDRCLGGSRVQNESMIEGSVTDAKGCVVEISNGSLNEFIHLIFTKQREHVFSKLILCQKFASLCKLLTENFHGINLDKVLDLTSINSRMKRGVYDQTPSLLSKDIQQLWGKINVIGSEMVSLAMSLIELSRMFFHEVAEGLDEGTSCDRNEELQFAASSDMKRTVDHADASIYSAATCRSCMKKSAPKEYLVCDSCEEVLHLSCIQPALKEIPYKNWFCSDCTRLGRRSMRKNCVPSFFWD
ncbi:hypothetical protein Droror1_Dr00012092 [Drosera rotundifolia]